MSERIKVSRLVDNVQWLVWQGTTQVASFTESNNWGPEGYYSGANYYGPNAERKANEYADTLRTDKELK